MERPWLILERPWFFSFTFESIKCKYVEGVLLFYSNLPLVAFENNCGSSFGMVSCWQKCIFPSLKSSLQWSIGMWVVQGGNMLPVMFLLDWTHEAFRLSVGYYTAQWHAVGAGRRLTCSCEESGKVSGGSDSWTGPERQVTAEWGAATKRGRSAGEGLASPCRGLHESRQRSIWRTERCS